MVQSETGMNSYHDCFTPVPRVPFQNPRHAFDALSKRSQIRPITEERRLRMESVSPGFVERKNIPVPEIDSVIPKNQELFTCGTSRMTEGVRHRASAPEFFPCHAGPVNGHMATTAAQVRGA